MAITLSHTNTLSYFIYHADMLGSRSLQVRAHTAVWGAISKPQRRRQNTGILSHAFWSVRASDRLERTLHSPYPASLLLTKACNPEMAFKARHGTCKFILIAMSVIYFISLLVFHAHAQMPTGAQAVENTDSPFPSVSQLSDDSLFSPATPGPAGIDAAPIQLVSFLTEGGPQINQGVVWRIFTPDEAGGSLNLIKQFKTATPVIELPPGVYMINVAFGLAHLTRRVEIAPGSQRIEKFVINAGGLRVIIKPSSDIFSGPINATFDLYSDERDQFGNRQNIMSTMRPGRITRLNSGIYRIVSRLGDANAIVASEVTVEAGKLTEATVLHEAAKVTFKLVQSAGGDALADAQWVILNRSSDKVVKKTAGALPTHIFAPGDYAIRASWEGNTYESDFTVKSGQNIEVEVLMR